MTWVILLFALGITLISLEVIIPGGVLGAIGALALFGGCAWSFIEFGRLGGTIATLCAFLAAGAILWIEFRLLPRTAIGRRAFLHKTVTGVSASYGEEAKALVGKAAEAITTLSPSGYVRIDGRRYEAFCEGGHTRPGTPLTVVGADNFRLIVTPAAPRPDPSPDTPNPDPNDHD